MNWKKIVLVVVVVFFLILVYRYFNSYRLADIDSSNYDSQMQSYSDYLEQQRNEYSEYMRKLNEQLLRSNELMDISAKNQEKYSELIERWEKQADRLDKVLFKIENN